MRTLVAATLIGLSQMLAGCGGPKLRQPQTLVSPYPHAEIWGVVPLLNESGTSSVDVLRLTDAVQRAVQETSGIDCAPVNRTLAALRSLELDRIRTPHDAHAVMQLLDLDGLIVGSISAYDPYRPVLLGLTFELFRREASDTPSLNIRELERAPSGQAAISSLGNAAPRARASGIFSASNHQVLKWLSDYADGRSVAESAYGRDIYHVSMDLYTQFVSHRLLADLLLHEHERLNKSPNAHASR